MDIRNILNTEGTQRKSPSHARSMSFSISGDQFAPPSKLPRAYSTISDTSPMSNHDNLQSPIAPSSGYGSPEFQRQMLPGQSQHRSSFRHSPEMRRESMFSITPTTARSSPDFPRDILNANGNMIPSHSSPIERKSSTPSAMNTNDLLRRSSSKATHAQAHVDQSVKHTSPDVSAGQKRKADRSPESALLLKQARTNAAAFPGNGQTSSIVRDLTKGSSPALLHSVTVPKTSKSPSPLSRREHGTGEPSISLGSVPSKSRAAEVPVWATRVPLGRKRIVAGNSLDSRAPQAQRRSPRPSTPVPKVTPMAEIIKAEPNVTGSPLTSSMGRTISEWLWSNVISQDQFPSEGPVTAAWEVEAKLGTIINKETDMRYANGSMTDCVLAPDLHNVKFDSGLSADEFKNLNSYLNEEVARSLQPGRAAIRYSHPEEVDAFFQINKDARERLPAVVQHYLSQSKHPPKLRVTRDKKAHNAVTAKIIKARMSDLHILCPQSRFDIRISVSLEINWDGNVEDLVGTQQDERNKNRLSYKHQASHIDVTQVRTSSSLNHEAEIELDVEMLRHEAAKIDAEGTAPFENLVMQLVDNAMVLNRAAATAVPFSVAR